MGHLDRSNTTATQKTGSDSVNAFLERFLKPKLGSTVSGFLRECREAHSVVLVGKFRTHPLQTPLRKGTGVFTC